MNARLAIAILAAGKADRFGGGKLDASLAGQRLGSYAVEAALPLGIPRIVVGHPPPEFASEALACGEAQLLENKRAAEGLGSSVALAAMQASAAGADALLLLLADMPQISTESLRKIAKHCSPGRPSATIHHGGQAGIPACFPADWFPKLAGLEGDSGAGALLRGAEEVAMIEVPHAELVDIDTQDDLSTLASRHRL